MNKINRKRFLTSIAVISGASLMPNKIFPFQSQDEPKGPIDKNVVHEFVKVSHNDFDRAKEILSKYPHIINSAWDWGDGDFETAIGAAGHMGHRDYALYLISQGARTDVFVLAMLGQTEIVKSMLSQYPNLLNSLGPHGFTLLHHAKQGKEHSAELYEFLQSKGLKETIVKIYKK